MSDPRTLHSGPVNLALESTREEWEDWSDEDPLSPLSGEENDGRFTDNNTGTRLAGQHQSGSTISHPAIQRIKSRARQKAQNTKAGITLVTDMSKLPPQPEQARKNRVSRTGKFVDAAALNALEGGGNKESSGLQWLKKRPSAKDKAPERLEANKPDPDRLGVDTPSRDDLSPSVGPIMIGFEMPSDSNVVISPQTAVVETPIDFFKYFRNPPPMPSPKAPVSAWSPDSDEGPESRRPNVAEGVLSAQPERRNRAFTALSSDDEDDMGTPITLFEEDGSPLVAQKSLKQRAPHRITVASTRSQGWWDQVTTPFTRTPDTPKADKQGEDEWWRDADQKKPPSDEPTIVASPTRNMTPVVQKPTSPTYKTTSPLSTPTFPGDKKKVEADKSLVSPKLKDKSPGARQKPPVIFVEEADSPKQPLPLNKTMASFQERIRAQQEQIQTQQEQIRAQQERLRRHQNRSANQGSEAKDSPELPPPYSPPMPKNGQPKKLNVRYRAVFPPEDPRSSIYPPSPGPATPGLARTMTSQGAIGLQSVPLTPQPAIVHDGRLPDRPLGSFLPSDHLGEVGRGNEYKGERQRRRHEREDAVAWKAGRLWNGRSCLPTCCVGRPGREGRKRRRWCAAICVLALIIIALAVVLPILLLRRPVEAPQSIFLNLTDFPPMPTGILTVAGADMGSTSNCVAPGTMWACSLPKEQAELSAPYEGSNPTFVIQVQFDNSTRRLWNTPPGVTPVPTPVSGGQTAQSSILTASAQRRAVRANGGSVGAAPVQARQNPAFRPDPEPPSFQEMFFLGNTTDGVVSRDKAGEPTPFFISILRRNGDSAGPTVLTRRQSGSSGNIADLLPPPQTELDGTAAPAVLLPFPKQQPVRLYDRGLPTERYGFYTYYDKTTYLKSIDAPSASRGSGPVLVDTDGGARRTEANFVVTWLSVRYKVEIWTRRSDSTRLVSDPNRPTGNSTRPGTFPYPVTITLDTHGGQPGKKFSFARSVDARQRILLTDPKLVVNNMGIGTPVINPQGENFNPSFGGMDGGTGGCKCEYTNFLNVGVGKGGS